MTSIFLDEQAADKATIDTLLRELKRRDHMQIFKLEDGRVIRAHSYDLLSQDELKAMEKSLKDDLNTVRNMIETPAEAPAEPAPVPEAPADPGTESVSSDAAQNDTAPVSEPQVAQPAPVETPAAPAEAPVEEQAAAPLQMQ